MFASVSNSSKPSEQNAPAPAVPAVPPGAFPDFNAMHVAQPNHLLHAFQRNFQFNNPNFSGEVAPHPDKLVRPPPLPTIYWVVMAGEKIGLCHDPGQVDLSRIFLLLRFSIDRFENWEDAVKFYTEKFETGTLGMMKFVDLGMSDAPIAVQSNQPTPVPPKKKTQINAPKLPKPSGAATRVRRKLKVVPALSDSPSDMYVPDPPPRPRIVVDGSEGQSSVSAPPKVQVAATPSDSPGGFSDMYVPDSPPPPRIVVVGSDDDDSVLPQPGYAQAALALASEEPMTPLPNRKRPHVSPFVGPEEEETPDFGVSPTLAERGFPVPKTNRPSKKVRGDSQPSSPNLQGPEETAGFVPAARPLQPLLFVGLASPFPSTSSQAPLASFNHFEGLDDNDPKLPLYPFHSSQRNVRDRIPTKVKGKGKPVFKDGGN